METELNKIVVLGSCSVDFTTYAPKLPEPGETLHGYKFCTSFGGKGANQCIAAAKLGGNVAMVARVGDDKWGHDYIENFKNCNVDTSHVYITPDQGTGIAQINVSKSGENQIVIVAGSNKALSENDVKTAENLITNASVLLCQLETPVETTLRAFQLCKGIKILNAAPASSRLNEELLKLTTILCVNETEASILLNKPVVSISDVTFAIKELLKTGCETVVITLGGNGAAYASIFDPQPYHIKSDTVNVVDTTGAGDAFLGVLATLLAMTPDIPLKNAIGSACRVASESVTKEGTQTSYPSMSYMELYADEYKVKELP